MKKLLIYLTIILSFNSTFSQITEANDYGGFITIGYFSLKNQIAIKGKILQFEDYTFLQIALDEELYTSDYDSNDVSFQISLGTGKQLKKYVYLSPISNRIKDKNVHLILLNPSDIEALKQNNVVDIEISLGYSTTYNFKNIQEPKFFINQLK